MLFEDSDWLRLSKLLQQANQIFSRSIEAIVVAGLYFVKMDQ